MNPHKNPTLNTALAACTSSADAAAIVEAELSALARNNLAPGNGRLLFYTWSDVGAARVSHPDLDFLVPNHRGDGETHVLVALDGSEPVDQFQLDFPPAQFLKQRADGKFGYGGDLFADIPCTAFNKDMIAFQVGDWKSSGSFSVRRDGMKLGCRGGMTGLMDYDCASEKEKMIFPFPNGDYFCWSFDGEIFISRRRDDETNLIVQGAVEEARRLAAAARAVAPEPAR